MKKTNSQNSIYTLILLGVVFMLPVYSCNVEIPVEPKVEFTLSKENLKVIGITKDVIQQHLANSYSKGSDPRKRHEILNSEAFMLDVSDQVNNGDFAYTPVPTTSWDDPLLGNNLAMETEHQFTTEDLSVPVRGHLTQFESRIEAIVTQYENGIITEEEGIARMKSECSQTGNSVVNNPMLTELERNATAESFYMMDELTMPLTNYVEDYAVANGLSEARFFRRLVRAIARVVVAVVVTAVIIAVPVVAVAVAKAAITGVALSAVKIGAAKGIGAIMKASIIKGKIGGISTYSPILTGMYAGLKNAEKNWDKPWQGASEFVFGYKVKL
jgi:hypothetical protein